MSFSSSFDVAGYAPPGPAVTSWALPGGRSKGPSTHGGTRSSSRQRNHLTATPPPRQHLASSSPTEIKSALSRLYPPSSTPPPLPAEFSPLREPQGLNSTPYSNNNNYGASPASTTSTRSRSSRSPPPHHHQSSPPPPSVIINMDEWDRQKERKVQNAFDRVLEHEWYDKYEPVALSPADQRHVNAVREHFAMRRNRAQTPHRAAAFAGSAETGRRTNTMSVLEWAENVNAMQMLGMQADVDLQDQFDRMAQRRAAQAQSGRRRRYKNEFGEDGENLPDYNEDDRIPYNGNFNYLDVPPVDVETYLELDRDYYQE